MSRFVGNCEVGEKFEIPDNPECDVTDAGGTVYSWSGQLYSDPDGYPLTWGEVIAMGPVWQVFGRTRMWSVGDQVTTETEVMDLVRYNGTLLQRVNQNTPALIIDGEIRQLSTYGSAYGINELDVVSLGPAEIIYLGTVSEPW